VLGGGEVQRHVPVAFPDAKRHGTNCTWGWEGPRSVLDGCGKSRPHWDSIQRSSSPYRVAIRTALPPQAGEFKHNLKKGRVEYGENLAVIQSYFRNNSANGTTQLRSVYLKILTVVWVVTEFTSYVIRTFIIESKNSHYWTLSRAKNIISRHN
jgi:hypothetical protein